MAQSPSSSKSPRTKFAPRTSGRVRVRPAVALLVETSNAYARGLLAGITAYVREHAPWSIYLPEQVRGARPPEWLARWDGNGLIARIENPTIAAAITERGLPVVDVSAARTIPTIPWVETDDEAISQLAVRHFVERGFRTLAFCGANQFNWSRWRCDSFKHLAETAGCACFVHEGAGAPSGQAALDREHDQLVEWVRSLPKPVGIMACYDIKAQQLLDACRDLSLAVPEDVAVLGVDNDELLCNLCTPPLSSIAPDAQLAGYRAAELLDSLMTGAREDPRGHLVKPLGLITRQSTDVYAVADREIAAALRFIREHACDGITVADVLGTVSYSRRVFESRFQEMVSRSPHAEIVRLRMERVKQLLLETDLPLAAIADRAGIPHVEYMTVAFKRETGLAPREFRRRKKQK